MHAVKIYCKFILRNNWTWTWKNLGYLAGLRLTLWYIGLGIGKYLNCLSPLGLISRYIGLWLEKCPHYLTGVRLILEKLEIKKPFGLHTRLGLILLYIGLGLTKWMYIVLTKQIKCH